MYKLFQIRACLTKLFDTFHEFGNKLGLIHCCGCNLTDLLLHMFHGILYTTEGCFDISCCLFRVIRQLAYFTGNYTEAGS